MRGWTLGSGSSGNALLIESAGHRILIDCGFGPRALATRLKMIGVAPESVGALVLTHEHSDHAQGAERAQKKWRWPVFGSSGTLGSLGELEPRWRRPIASGSVTEMDGFTLEAVGIPHDAAGPLAYVVTSTATGARVAVAHDLGAVTDSLRRTFARCDALCIEANHDVEMLANGPYHASLKARIRGGRGHISNDASGELAAQLASSVLRSVVLLHLSETNNTPQIAARAVAAPLRRTGYRGPVTAAPRREPALAFELASPVSAVVQLPLGL